MTPHEIAPVALGFRHTENDGAPLGFVQERDTKGDGLQDTEILGLKVSFTDEVLTVVVLVVGGVVVAVGGVVVLVGGVVVAVVVLGQAIEERVTTSE
jgi:ABC-type cobalamin transport system permease subunit